MKPIPSDVVTATDKTKIISNSLAFIVGLSASSAQCFRSLKAFSLKGIDHENFVSLKIWRSESLFAIQFCFQT